MSHPARILAGGLNQLDPRHPFAPKAERPAPAPRVDPDGFRAAAVRVLASELERLGEAYAYERCEVQRGQLLRRALMLRGTLDSLRMGAL